MSRVRAILVCVMVLGGSTALAELPGPATDSHHSLPPFHRLFLPAREIERRDWKQRYLPVDAAEFERDLKIVADHERGAPSSGTPRLRESSYIAQLIGEDLLVGTAQFEIATDGQQPTLMAIEPCSVAIESARWPETDKAATLAFDPQGQLKLLVEGTRLDLRWSQRGQRTASGAVLFELELPPSLVGRLILSVPAGAEIVAEGGVVTRTAEPPGETAPTASRWIIEPSGSRSLRLRVVPQETAGQRRPLTLLRQSTTYEFTTRGINVAAQLRLDIHGEPLERLEIDLDPALHLISAKTGDVAIPWSSATDVDSGETHVILEFQEPLSGTGRVVQLSSVTPLVTGETVLLPRVRPRQVAWQEGSASLLVPAALVLEQLKATGGRQSRVTTLPAPLTGESIEVQFFEAGGRIETRIAEPQQQSTLSCTHSVEVAPDAITTSSVFELEGDDGKSRVLELPLRAGWSVDSVQGAQGGESLQWDVESNETNAILRVQSGKLTRIVVRAHAPLSEAEQQLGAAALRAFDLSSLAVASELLSVQGTDGLEVRWQNESPVGRDPKTLSPQELERFVQPPTERVVLVDEDLEDARISVERERPEYAADLRVDVVAQQDTLTETFTIQCTPAVSRVDRLLVHLSQAHDESVKWNLAGGNNSGEFSARRLSAGEQAKLGLPEGEVWELLLKLARLGTFEVRGQRKLSFSAETPVTLASAPDAANQRGTVAIRAIGETGLAIQNRGLIAVPAEALDDEHYQTARATYHYQPAADDFTAEARVMLIPGAPLQASTGAWTWSIKLTSRFGAEGQMTNEALINVQTAGRRQVALTLPAGSRLTGIWIDNVRASRLDLADASKPIPLELPPGKSRVQIVVHYSTPASLPLLAGKFSPPFPKLDTSLVHRQWRLWLPPGHQVGDANGWLSSTQLAPLTWSERLFGALGRGSDRNLFNPLVAADWRDNFAGGVDATSAGGQARQLLTAIGKLLTEYQDAEELTWGQLLAAAAELQSDAGVQLLVDPTALAEAGIGPLTRLRLADDEPDVDRAHSLLKNARLFIVAVPDRVLITSSARVAGFNPRLLNGLENEMAATARGVLGERLRSIPGKEGPFCPVASWLTNPDAQLSPVEFLRPSPVETAGWRRYDLPCSDNGLSEVRIVHVSRMQSLAWAILLGAVGLCLWRPRLRGNFLAFALGVLAAVALVVPTSFSPLTAAALLGVLIGGLSRMIATGGPAVAPKDATAPRGSQSKFVQPVVSALVLAAIANAGAALDAGEPETAPNSPTKGKPLYTVLFPVDEQRRPAGSMVYVPEPLYEKLLRESAAASGRPQAWMITRAAYDGTLSRDATSTGLSIPTLKARFELEVFQSNLPIRVPLSREVWATAVSSARLDGRTLPMEWQQDAGLLLGSLSLGNHVLELELRPNASNDARSAGIDLPIPRVAQATLNLTGPQDLENLRIISARGRVTLDAERDSLTAQLGSTDRLAIRWPSVQIDANAAGAADLQVDELVWVRARPGTTVLDARFKFQVGSGELRSVRLATDPRLRLLTSPANGTLVSAVRTFPGSPQIIEFDLAQPARESITLDVSFLVTDASGVGNLRLPRLEASDAKPARRWLGVSVDPALQYRIQAGEDSPSVDLTKFLEAWGSGDAKPLAAFAISRGEPIWFLATQPAEPKVSVQQKTIFNVGRHSADVRFEASLDITAGVLAQLAIASPQGFKLDRVSVRDQDVERVTRWAIDEKGQISIFLTTPISGRQQLLLTGRWTLPDERSIEVPHWNLDAATVSRGEWEFYRQSEVLLTVIAPPEARPLERPQDAVRSEKSSLAAAFQADSANLSFGFQVAANDPQVHGVAVTTVRRENDRLLATIDYHVDVTDGVLDALQFDVPAQFVEPIRTEPPANVSVAAPHGSQRRVLTITPTAPLSGKHTLRLQGRIAPSPGDRLGIPDIRPLAADRLERYVALPKRLQSQPVSWETSRLAGAKLPAELLPRGWKADSVSIFKVQDTEFRASLKTIEREDAQPTVQLADIHLIWWPEDGWRAAATYDLLPGGATECELQLPADCQLVSATVEQLPASLIPLGKDKYKLTLGPQRLPQRIELLYTASAAARSSQPVLDAPRLADVEPHQTLWTVYHVPHVRLESIEQRFMVSASDQQLVRLASTARLVDLPADVLGEHLPEEIARWYGNWRRRYWSDRVTLRRSLIAAGRDPLNSEEAGEARGLDQQMMALDDRLGASKNSGLSAPTHDHAHSFWHLADASLVREHYSLKATDGPLRIRSLNTSAASPLRWLTALGSLTLGTLLGWQLRGRELPRQPAILIAAGVAAAWWLLLGPSMWGLLALVLILLAVLWSRNRTVTAS